MTERVALLTGVSGFLGGHVALQLLNAGYRVRGTVRSLAKAEKVQQALAAASGDTSRLEIIELDLLADKGWSAAANGCTYLVHTASPFFLTMPRDPDDLIRPAVDGTRRALFAALDANLQRIVLTSSIAAIVYGHNDYSRVFSESDWSNLAAPGITAYIRSKTLAERLAWEIVDQANAHDRLAVINPGTILGPFLDDDPGTTGELIVRMLKGKMPAAPGIVLGWVDVRDVAAAHVAALESNEAGGRRHIVSERNLSLMQIARTLGSALPASRKNLPRFEMPGWLVRIAGIFDASLRDAAVEIGLPKRTDGSRAKALLGRQLISATDAVIATARSAIERGLA